jgi:GT2 family glycosyltransferase
VIELKKVAIIIVTWNRRSDLLECLDSLAKLSYPTYEVIVVDNASTDGSAHEVSQRFPHVTLIKNVENLGFVGGNNIGIDLARGKGAEYIFLLNDDTIVTPDLITELVKIAESAIDIGIVGASVYSYHQPTEVLFKGGNINRWFGTTASEDSEPLKAVRQFDYVAGCSMLVKKNVIDKIGLLDSRFFMYFEDTDWCFRARKAGYRIVCTPQAKVWHKGAGQVTSLVLGPANITVLYLTTRNRALFMRKNVSSINFFVFLLTYIVGYVFLRAVCLIASGEKRHAVAVWLGFRDFMLGRFGKPVF